MSAGSDLLIALYPQYTGDGRVDTYLEVAALQHTAIPWGAVYTLAMAHYAAHGLMIADLDADAVSEGGNAGAANGLASGVRSRTAGAESITYATPSASDAASLGLAAGDDELLKTSAGRAYLRLRKSRPAGSAQLVRATC